MGVKGLTSYVRDHGGNLTVPHLLHNCEVVIDANNLLYFLYYRTDIEWRFGGEYDLYANAVRRFFSQMRACRVTCHVLFDGCYSPDAAKFKTTMSRARDRMDSLRRLNKGLNSGRLLPPLAAQVLVSVLEELEIDHLTCADEADVNIAAMALDLACPVLSNDSDFFVFGLPGGVISLDSLSMSVSSHDCDCCEEETSVALSCSRFVASRLSRWGMETPFLPLLATLLGNDFVPRKDLDLVFSRVKLPKPSRRAGKRHGRTDSLLQWLRRFDDPNIALQSLLSFVGEEAREGVRTRLQRCLQQYETQTAWIHTRQRLECLSASPVAWDAFVRHRLVAGLVNASVCGYVFLLPGPERLSLPSAHSGTSDVRQQIYAALHPTQPLHEYDRRDGNICKTKVTEVAEEVQYEDIVDAVQTVVQRPTLRAETGDELQPILCVMAFWASRYRVDKLHITSLLLSIVCRLDLCRELPPSLCQEDSRRHRVDVLAKYLASPAVNHAKPLDLAATHAFVAFQNCLFAFSQLLWCGAVKDTDAGDVLTEAHKFLVGRLFYNLLADLKRRSESSLFIHELLGRNSPLNAWFWEKVKVLRDCQTTE